MRRVLMTAALAVSFVVVGAAPALAAHCINRSKPDGAGSHTDVIVNIATGEATLQGKNGGFADVYLDFNGDGIGDLQVENDVFIAGNHNDKFNPGQTGEDGLAVVPGAFHNPSDHGIGFPEP